MPGEAFDQRIPRYVSTAGAAWLGSVSLVVLTAWAALAEVDVVIAAPASARPTGGTIALRAPGSRRVADVLTTDGDHVTAGQLVVRLDDDTARSRWRSSSVALDAKRAHLEMLQTVARLLDDGSMAGTGESEEVRLRLLEHRSRRAKLADETEALAAELRALRARVAASRQLLRIREERHRAAETAFQLGALSRFDLLRIWQESLSQRADLQAGEDQVAVLRARIGSHRNATREILAADRQALASGIAALQVEVAELETGLAEAGDRHAESRIVAPVAGVVEQLTLSPGEHVERGEVVAMIVPADRPLVFETRVLPQQAAFLQRGQTCRIKLDALPFARYGALPCTVDLVSHDVVAADRGGGHYLVRVRPATERLEADGRLVRLQPGATAWVDILAGRRTVLSFVTEPLRRFAAESLREL